MRLLDTDACVTLMARNASAAFALHPDTRTLLYINSQCRPKQARQFGDDNSIAYMVVSDALVH